MTKSLLKLLPKALATREEARKTSNEAAQAKHDFTMLEEERDKKLSQITDEYGGRISALKKHYASLVTALKNWSLGHRAEEFGDKQSILLDGNKLAFHMGTGKCEFLKDGKVAKDADAVEAILATGDDDLIEAALSLNPKPDKVAIKALLAETGNAHGQRLAALGFVITKEEDFDFQPATRADNAGTGTTTAA